MATNKQRKRFPLTLQESIRKLAVMSITISIGLWCGWHDSYGAFYIAVLIQAINNMYDSFSFLKGYTKFVTFFQIATFIGALVSFIISIIHFAPGGKTVDSRGCLFFTCVFLSVPVIHYGIEISCMLRDENY